MTSPAIQLAQSVGLIGDTWAPGYKKYGLFHLSVDSFIIEQALERFHARAKAQALKEASDRIIEDYYTYTYDSCLLLLRRMAEELEKK